METEENLKFKMNYDVNCPADLLSNENISDTELRVYLVIRAFARGKEKACFLSNEKISDLCNKSYTVDKKTGQKKFNAVEKAIYNLKNKKYIYVDTRQNRVPKRKIFIGKQAFEKTHGLSDDNSPLPEKFNNVSHFRQAIMNRATGFTLKMTIGTETLYLMIANNGIVNKETFNKVDDKTAKAMWEHCYEYREQELRNYIKLKEQK